MGPWREQEAPEGGVGVWPQPLGSHAQVKAQLEKFHYPKGAKEKLPGWVSYAQSMYVQPSLQGRVHHGRKRRADVRGCGRSHWDLRHR